MTNKTKLTIIIVPTCLALVVSLGIFILIKLLQGNTVITNKYTDKQPNEFVRCTIDNLEYPFFVYNKSDKSTTEINIIFSMGRLMSISLVHRLYYNSPEMAHDSEILNHAAMNMNFGAELGADALRANYDMHDKEMRMSLYAELKDLNESSKKYFLIFADLEAIEDYIRNYEEYKFNCVRK